jgi:hypothetical protein
MIAMFSFLTRRAALGSQQSCPCVIPEQIGVAHIGLQDIHAFVPRHVPHLEHGSAAARCAG